MSIFDRRIQKENLTQEEREANRAAYRARQEAERAAAQAAKEENAAAETRGELSAAGFEWIKENGNRWEKPGKVRYYLNDIRAILEKAGVEITEERKGRILSIDELSHNKSYAALASLDKLYFDAREGKLVGNGWIVRQLLEALQEEEAQDETVEEEIVEEKTEEAAPVVETEAVSVESTPAAPRKRSTSRKARTVAKLAALGWMMLPGMIL